MGTPDFLFYNSSSVFSEDTKKSKQKPPLLLVMALPSLSFTKSFPATANDYSILTLPSNCLHSTLQFPCKPTTQKLSFELQSRRLTSASTRTNVSFFPAFLTKSKDAKTLKEELLEAIEPLDRGANATPEDQQRIDQLARKLEAVNPTKAPLKSDLLNGKWELIYTTSKSILQTQRPKFLRSRVNYQAINVDTLRAQNMETWPFFNQVTADLKPVNSRKVAVKFDYFKILGLIPVKAPERALGSLEITYLDEELSQYQVLMTDKRLLKQSGPKLNGGYSQLCEHKKHFLGEIFELIFAYG